jgi:hypothetical protein
MADLQSICTVDECARRATVKRMCRLHYDRVQRTGSVALIVREKDDCSVEGCLRKERARGLCALHIQRLYKHGDPGEAAPRTGDGTPKRGRDGYVMLTVRGRRMLEHRYVMERMLGRRLLGTETVHHINGVRHDNRPGNLELWSSSQPSGQRVDDLVAWAHEILATYRTA